MAKRESHRYAPGPISSDLTGVRRGVDSMGRDFYSGEKFALVAAGLLPAHLFPGEPGMGATCAVVYPEGVQIRHCGHRATPGALEVRRTASGKFQIAITPGAKELERRRQVNLAAHRKHFGITESGRPAAAAEGEDGIDGIVFNMLDVLTAQYDVTGIRAGATRWLASRVAGSRPVRRAAHLCLAWPAPQGLSHG
jgi:hypothetical protein